MKKIISIGLIITLLCNGLVKTEVAAMPLDQPEARTIAAWASDNLVASHGYPHATGLGMFSQRWIPEQGLLASPGNGWLNFVDQTGRRNILPAVGAAGAGGINALTHLAIGQYWHMLVDVTGHQNIQIQWNQRTTATGPRDWQVAYSFDGVNWYLADEPVRIGQVTPLPNSVNQGESFRRQLPEAAEGVGYLHIKIMIASSVAVNGGNIGSTATHHIGNLHIYSVRREVELPYDPVYPPNEEPELPHDPVYPPNDEPDLPQDPVHPPSGDPEFPHDPVYPPNDEPDLPQDPVHPPSGDPEFPQDPVYPPNGEPELPQDPVYPPSGDPEFPQDPVYPPDGEPELPQDPVYPPISEPALPPAPVSPPINTPEPSEPSPYVIPQPLQQSTPPQTVTISLGTTAIMTTEVIVNEQTATFSGLSAANLRKLMEDTEGFPLNINLSHLPEISSLVIDWEIVTIFEQTQRPLDFQFSGGSMSLSSESMQGLVATAQLEAPLIITLRIEQGLEDANELAQIMTDMKQGSQEIPYELTIPLAPFGEELTARNLHRLIARTPEGALIGGQVNQEAQTFGLKAQGQMILHLAYAPTLHRVALNTHQGLLIDLAENGENQTMDVLPILEGDQVLVPVRFLAYILDLPINWNPETAQIQLSSDTQSLQLPLGELTPELKAMGIETPLQLHQERTFISLDFVAKFFNMHIHWSQETGDIELLRERGNP